MAEPAWHQKKRKRVSFNEPEEESLVERKSGTPAGMRQELRGLASPSKAPISNVTSAICLSPYRLHLFRCLYALDHLLRPNAAPRAKSCSLCSARHAHQLAQSASTQQNTATRHVLRSEILHLLDGTFESCSLVMPTRSYVDPRARS